jgi:hypothetical protein
VNRICKVSASDWLGSPVLSMHVFNPHELSFFPSLTAWRCFCAAFFSHRALHGAVLLRALHCVLFCFARVLCLSIFFKHSTNVNTYTSMSTHLYEHTYAHPTPMSTYERWSRLDLKIHEVGH